MTGHEFWMVQVKVHGKWVLVVDRRTGTAAVYYKEENALFRVAGIKSRWPDSQVRHVRCSVVNEKNRPQKWDIESSR